MVKKRLPAPVSAIWNGAALRKMMNGLTVSVPKRKPVRYVGVLDTCQLINISDLPDNFQDRRGLSKAFFLLFE